LAQYTKDYPKSLLSALHEGLFRVIGLRCITVIARVNGWQWLDNGTTNAADILVIVFNKTMRAFHLTDIGSDTSASLIYLRYQVTCIFLEFVSTFAIVYNCI